MMSLTELPLQTFFERSASFCYSVRSDLDQFINEVENEFSSINREVKIAPRLRRKGRLVDIPGSCRLDLKEFTGSKESALRNLETSFDEMETRWSANVAELKDWIFTNVESCLSKMQLQIKVTAEDLNLPTSVCEIDLCEENSSSSSEISLVPVSQRNISRFHPSTPLVASTKKNAKRTSRVQARKSASATESGREKIIKVSKTPSTSARTSGVNTKKIDWRSFLSAVEDAPSEPGMYEMKVWNAKNPAYIGHGDDLKKCLSLHCEGKSSGNRHFNLFIQRNKEEMSVRYVAYPSLQLAKLEQKRRLKEFLETHKKLPSYNYRV